MEASEILEGLSPQEKRLILALDQLNGKASVDDIFEVGGFRQMVEVMNAASWLQSKGLVKVEETTRNLISVKNKEVLNRLIEINFLSMLNSDFKGSANLASIYAGTDSLRRHSLLSEDIPIALGWNRRNNWIDIRKSDEGTIVSTTASGESFIKSHSLDNPSSLTGEERILTALIGEGPKFEDELGDPNPVEKLRKRKEFFTEKLIVIRTLSFTPLGREVLSMGIELKDEVAQLTPELLQSGKWRDVSFRKYDIRTFAPSVYPGKKHPLSRMADEVRRIFIEMGFEEIDEEYIQPAFWNMDALFIPQDHPARELQDTFYLKNPKEIELEDEDIVDIIAKVHEDGWETGSLGWGYKWDPGMAKKALLRTHTTVNTIRYLWKNPEPPIKVFSLSRVFRNEAIDATHLPEFVQIEGIIVEKGANLDMLVGVLKEFYRMMGFENIRVRPGYFPYTEPSLEVDVYYNGSWMELGGAGIFRPEVTKPFKVEYPVLAWGLGFERLAMLKWNLSDLRDLYISDLDMLRQSSIL